jgi:hypothetical protein
MQRPSLIAAATALWLAVGTAAAADGPRFLPGFEDLPLMPGLGVVEDATVVFDKPTGRIVEAQAVGGIGAAAVRAFYHDALPELGWAPFGGDSWGREGEMLMIEITEIRPGRVGVRFVLAPI